MERNPLDEFKRQYQASAKIKRIYPRIFWWKCDKCKNEFKKEMMYKCEAPTIIKGVIFEYYFNVKGCANCFRSEDEFKKHLIDREYLIKELLQ